MNLKINLNIFVCKFEPNKNLWSNSPEPSFLKILSRIFYLPRKYSQINYLSKNPPLINPREYFLKYPFLQDVSNYSLKFSKNILSNSLQRIPPKYPWKNHFLSFPFFLSPSSVLYELFSLYHRHVVTILIKYELLPRFRLLYVPSSM